MSCILTNICSVFLAMLDEMIYNFITSLEGGELLKEKISKDIKRICRYIKSKWLFIILIIIAILIRIINSEAPLLYPFTEWTFTEQLFLKPIDGSISGEILSFLDNLGMSFLASLVFLFISVTLPNRRKNKQIREEILDLIRKILQETANITMGRLKFYQKMPDAPKSSFEDLTEQEAFWIASTINDKIRICLRKNEYITGFQYMYECAEKIEDYISTLYKYYSNNIDYEERKVLKDLLNSDYIKYAESMASFYGTGEYAVMPEDTEKEFKRIYPQILAHSGIKFFCEMDDKEIIEAVRIYKKIKKVYNV